MFENKVYDNLIAEMLDYIPDNINKQEGSLIHNALAARALSNEEFYIDIEHTYDTISPDTAPREELILKAKDRGLEPKAASPAVYRAFFNCIVPIDSRFSCADFNFFVTKKINDTEYQIQCETVGTVGNYSRGELFPIEHIDGFEKGEILELIIPGEDEEETERFRQKYFDSFHSQAFGGNRADYRQKVNAIAGVGGCKPLRRKRGETDIKIVIIASDFTPPSTNLISHVQQIIDPLHDQEGDGLAPIGHTVKILGVTEFKIDLNLKIIFEKDFYYDSLKQTIENTIDDYFLESAKEWEKTDNLIIRIAKIISLLVDIDGILDVTTILLNQENKNITLEPSQIPRRGDIIVS